MKVNELYNAVALLGFENDIDEEETFFPALNTALHDVYRIVPRKKMSLLAHYPPASLVADTDKILYSGEGLSYEAEGAKAFYIEISGKGNITFKDGEKSISGVPDVTFDSPYAYQTIRGFCRDNNGMFPAKLVIDIKTETLCKVKAVAIYGDIASAKTEDIPAPGKYIAYSLGRIFPDFSTLFERPKWSGGNTLTDFRIEDGCLSVPRDTAGDIELTYTPKIHEYTVNDNEDDVDLPDEYIGALKLLIASYVWLDDNADRAQYYKGLYNEEIALISAKHRDLNPIAYESVNNW
ncbi:MAG: hypothetical protein IKT56_02830 [Clostridia bacterium]|nr:hypothetical protein [Clostridia bacterium]